MAEKLDAYEYIWVCLYFQLVHPHKLLNFMQAGLLPLGDCTWSIAMHEQLSESHLLHTLLSEIIYLTCPADEEIVILQNTSG